MALHEAQSFDQRHPFQRAVPGNTSRECGPDRCRHWHLSNSPHARFPTRGGRRSDLILATDQRPLRMNRARLVFEKWTGHAQLKVGETKRAIRGPVLIGIGSRREIRRFSSGQRLTKPPLDNVRPRFRESCDDTRQMTGFHRRDRDQLPATRTAPCFAGNALTRPLCAVCSQRGDLIGERLRVRQKSGCRAIPLRRGELHLYHVLANAHAPGAGDRS